MSDTTHGEREHMENLRQPDRAFCNRRTLDPALAHQLAEARRAAGTFRRVAADAGIAYGYLCELTKGRRCPTRPVAERLIAVLALDPETADELRRTAVDPAELAARHRRSQGV